MSIPRPPLLARFVQRILTVAILGMVSMIAAQPSAGARRPAAASEPDPALEQLRERMAALRRMMTELQEQLDALDPSRSTEAQESGAPPETPEKSKTPIAAESPRSGLGLYSSIAGGGPDWRGGGGQLSSSVKIGGYGSFRYEANNIDAGPRIGNLPRLRRGFDSFDFRRFVFTIDAAPIERLRFYTEIEFERLSKIEIERNAIPENRGRLGRDRAGTRFIQEVEGTSGGEIAVEQAWVQYDFSKSIAARIGVILPPVGRFNAQHDDDRWDLPRRPLVDRGGPVLPVKSAWSELGAGVVGQFPLGSASFDYQFYVVNGVQLDFTLEQVAVLREGRNLLEVEPEISFTSGAFNGTNTANAFTWRAAVTPRVGHQIGFSGYHGEYTPDYLIEDGWVNTFAFDGITTLGNFVIEGEYVHTRFGNMDAVLSDIALQLVDATAKTLSSETASLEIEIEGSFKGPFTRSRRGFWVDFKYGFWPRWLDRTFLGRDLENPRLVPIFRFERIWFDDNLKEFDFQDGRITQVLREDLAQQRTSLGLAYRPTPALVFTAAWEHNRRLSGSELIFPRPVGVDPLPDRSFDTLILGTAFGF